MATAVIRQETTKGAHTLLPATQWREGPIVDLYRTTIRTTDNQTGPSRIPTTPMESMPDWCTRERKHQVSQIHLPVTPRCEINPMQQHERRTQPPAASTSNRQGQVAEYGMDHVDSDIQCQPQDEPGCIHLAYRQRPNTTATRCIIGSYDCVRITYLIGYDHRKE
jgi:hypothetical protein